MAGREVQSSLGGLRDKDEPCHADRDNRHWGIVHEEVGGTEGGKETSNKHGLSFELGGSAL